MKTSSPTRLWSLLGLAACAMLASIAACGASASMGGGIAGTSSVLGAISGFGSVIVGGIEFDTDGARVTIEGDAASPADLRLGMVAEVRGVVERGGRRGVAEAVAVEDLAEGPVSAIDAAASTLVVLGQVVVVDGATVFEPTPLEGLEIGDVVEVSGFFDAEGRIRASRVQHKVEDIEIELKGTIRDLDTAAETFRLGDLVVDYGGAIVDVVPPGPLRDGLLVEVEADTGPIDGVLVAIGVETLETSLTADPGDGLDVEGFVTRIVSADEFVLNAGQRVRITATTRFERGRREDLVLNARVDVEGVAAEDGALIASEIEFRSSAG